MATTTVCNKGLYQKMIKSFFLETPIMIEPKLYMNEYWPDTLKSWHILRGSEIKDSLNYSL